MGLPQLDIKFLIQFTLLSWASGLLELNKLIKTRPKKPECPSILVPSFIVMFNLNIFVLYTPTFLLSSRSNVDDNRIGLLIPRCKRDVLPLALIAQHGIYTQRRYIVLTVDIAKPYDVIT